MDDLGRLGRIWRGAIRQPDRRLWLQSVQGLVAGCIPRRRPGAAPALRFSTDINFVERHEGPVRQLSLRIAKFSNPRAVRYRRLALAEQDREKADLLHKKPTRACCLPRNGCLRGRSHYLQMTHQKRSFRAGRSAPTSLEGRMPGPPASGCSGAPSPTMKICAGEAKDMHLLKLAFGFNEAAQTWSQHGAAHG